VLGFAKLVILCAGPQGDGRVGTSMFNHVHTGVS
jgi:hypothetical protein